MKKFLPILLLVFFNFLSHQTKSQLPGQTLLDPATIPKFVDPLPHFAGNRVDASGGNLVIKYQPLDQVVLSTGTVLRNGVAGIDPDAGKTHLWGYSISNGKVTTPPHWPAFTVVARQGKPVKVTYKNNLFGETYSSVGLVADQTIHWAAPTGMNMMDMTPYTGPVPVSPHLHGGEVPSESDGGPEAWFTPGYSLKGASWGYSGTDQYYFYPNKQEAATLWWHDHALGATRLNVYAGLAGFYILKGRDEELARLPGWSGDDLVKEVAPAGKTGVFSTRPYLPEIELCIQDRMFDEYGKLYYPDEPPNPMEHPFWTPEFMGNAITVNGKTWPYLSVAPRKYRFRILNGCNARFLRIKLRDIENDQPGPPVIVVGTDGGLLNTPFVLNNERFLLAPGERLDVVIDFSESVTGQVLTMINNAQAPFPDGDDPDPELTLKLMQFIVNGKMVSAANLSKPGTDRSNVPQSLRVEPLVKLTDFAGVTKIEPDLKRQLTLNEVMGMGGPLQVLVNNTKWMSDYTENPREGTTELWQIINLTADAHPIHLHLVQFQIVSRQPFDVESYNLEYEQAYGGEFIPAAGPPLEYSSLNDDRALGGNPAVSKYLLGNPLPARAYERGWKDTEVAMPGQVTTMIIRFAPTALKIGTPPSKLLFGFDPSKGPGYVWHCHIIDHEDNEMMRPYRVLPSFQRSPVKSDLWLTDENSKRSPGQATEDKISQVVLSQNYPNPATGNTEISFAVPDEGHVRIALYNTMGTQIMMLFDEDVPAGNNTAIVNAGNLNPGLYYYQLNYGSETRTKMMVIR